MSINDDPDYKTAYEDYNNLLHRNNIFDPKFFELFRSKLTFLTLKINFFPSFVSRKDEIFIMQSDWTVKLHLFLSYLYYNKYMNLSNRPF